METGRPEKVCGIHFFNPAPLMALVEVVRPITASDDDHGGGDRLRRACGKDPVEVKDQAGFVVNALLFPYLNNAVRLLEQGVATKEDIDAAMKGGCGFPMGPFALLDLVGLDTSLAILDALYEEYRTRTTPPCRSCGAWWPRSTRSEDRVGFLRLRPRVALARETGQKDGVPDGSMEGGG